MMHTSAAVVLFLGLCSFSCMREPAPQDRAVDRAVDRAAELETPQLQTPQQQTPLPQEPAPPVPDPLAAAWQAALALGRQHRAPVLAFVLPPPEQPADPASAAATRAVELEIGLLLTRDGERAPPMTTARDVFLWQLQLLRGAPDLPMCAWPPAPTQAQTVFLLTVPVVAAAATCAAEAGETVVLLSPSGERVQGFAIDLLDRAGFAEVVGAVVCADDALAQRRMLVPSSLANDLSLLKVYAQRSGEQAHRAHREVYDRLSSQLPAIAPAMIERKEGRLQADALLGLWERSRMPLGTELCYEHTDRLLSPFESVILQLVGE